MTSGLAEMPHGFVRLAGEATRFRKEVLRVWSGVDPNTGKPLKFTRGTLETLARNTNEWIRLGHEVYAPDGHTDEAMKNLGRWTHFEVEGDKLFGIFEPADSTIAAAIGTRIRGVSIFARGPVQASSGETLSFAILHVCLTPCPVLPDQENFIKLARACQEKKMANSPNASADPNADTKNTTLAAPEPAAASPATMSPKEFLLKAEGLLGLQNATWSDIFEALRTAIVGDSDDSGEADTLDAGNGMAPAIMARLARHEKAVETRLAAKFSADLEAIKTREKTGREAHARDLVELSRKRSAESGVLFAKDEVDMALSMLSSESEQMQKAGRAFLAAQDKLAEGSLKLAQSGRRVATPEHEQKIKLALSESDAAVSAIIGKPFDAKQRTLSAP